MFQLTDIPCWYFGFALIVSAYQAYRGFMFQWIFGDRFRWTTTRKVLLLCCADMFTYCLCALSGFYSFFAAHWIATHHSESTKELEQSAFLIFLVLYGVLGATGKLPDILHKLDIFEKLKPSKPE